MRKYMRDNPRTTQGKARKQFDWAGYVGETRRVKAMVKQTEFKMVKEDDFVKHWWAQGLSQIEAERKWDAAEGDLSLIHI
eukprot:5282588-Alexandrium_andersonii.AAC.1